MSQVMKPGASGTAGAGASAHRGEGEGSARAGEFEAVLDHKGRDPHAAEAKALPGAGSRTAARHGEPPPERSGEVVGWRGLPGDLALPATPRFEAGGPAAADSARTAEAMARVERIAELVLRGVELRLGPDGAAAARLELDLGGLGQLRVALDRSAEGVLAVRFEDAGPQAARLLIEHGGELVARLEARGLALGEVALVGRDGPVVRLGPAPEAQSAELARPRSGERAASQRDHDRDGREDERPRRPPALPEEDD
jgi:hypothetical protein